jgi:hypothetical protein
VFRIKDKDGRGMREFIPHWDFFELPNGKLAMFTS